MYKTDKKKQTKQLFQQKIKLIVNQIVTQGILGMSIYGYSL